MSSQSIQEPIQPSDSTCNDTCLYTPFTTQPIQLLTTMTQPFGTLSNSASTPITIDDVHYDSVTHYIYKDVLQTIDKTDVRYTRPLSVLVDKTCEEDISFFNDKLIEAMKYRYNNDTSLKRRLHELNPNVLDFKPSLLELCNKSKDLHTFFNPLTDNTVLLDSKDNDGMCTRLNAALIGIVRDMNQSPEANVFNDSVYNVLDKRIVNVMLYNMGLDLLKDINTYDDTTDVFAIYNSYKRATDLSTATVRNYKYIDSLTTINGIVADLKTRLLASSYQREIEIFKSHLLDVALDVVLKQDYPQLDESQYETAKQQQFQQTADQTVNGYKEMLYSSFMHGTLNDEISNKLSPELIPIFPTYAIDYQLMYDNVTIGHRYQVDLNDSLMPHHASSIVINNKRYSSAVAYAYAQLFIHRIGLIFSDDDDVQLPVLARTYHNTRMTRMRDSIVSFNNKATVAKFSKYKELNTLLYYTSNSDIEFSNPSDYVLGCVKKPDGSYIGLNESGKLLVRMRKKLFEESYDPLQCRGFGAFHELSTNIVSKEWFISRVLDYGKTLGLFQRKDINDLCSIYRLEAITVERSQHVTSLFATDDDTLIEFFRQCGITCISDCHSVLKCIHAEYTNLRLGCGIKEMVQSYDTTEPTQSDTDHAVRVVKGIYHVVKDRLFTIITEESFVDCLLLERNYEPRVEHWWRVNRYAKLSVVYPIGWDDTIPTVLSYTTAGIDYKFNRVIALSLSALMYDDADGTGVSYVHKIRRDKLADILKEGSTIIVFIDSITDFGDDDIDLTKQGLKQIIDDIDLPLKMYVSIADDGFCKPITGIWDLFLSRHNVTCSSDLYVIYVGPRMGRTKHESAVDYMFAFNTGMRSYTPEFFFEGKDGDVAKYNIPSYPPVSTTIPSSLYDPPITVDYNVKQVIILVGYNGSGKTTFVKNYMSDGNAFIVDPKTQEITMAMALFDMYCGMNEQCIICVDDDDNVTSESRKRYEEIANAKNVPCVYFCFVLSLDHRLHNIKYRRIVSNNPADRIETPVDDDGFMADLMGKRVVKVNFIPVLNSDIKRSPYYKYLLANTSV